MTLDPEELKRLAAERRQSQVSARRLSQEAETPAPPPQPSRKAKIREDGFVMEDEENYQLYILKKIESIRSLMPWLIFLLIAILIVNITTCYTISNLDAVVIR